MSALSFPHPYIILDTYCIAIVYAPGLTMIFSYFTEKLVRVPQRC